jgi:tetratricopeptide (TPR) repeat protein
LPSPSPDLPDCGVLTGQIVVFTGKLSLLGRKDARALVTRLGGFAADDVNARTTLLVVGAEGFGTASHAEDLEVVEDAADRPKREKSLKLIRAEQLNLAQERQIRIVSEEEFCEMAGVPTNRSLRQQYYSMRDLLARYGSLREDHVRYLVKYGIVYAIYRTNADTFFGFPDLATFKEASEELERGTTFRAVVRSLIASRQGQLALDFRLDAAPAKIIALRPRPAAPAPSNGLPPVAVRDTAIAEEFFREGSALDDGSDGRLEDAAAAYRKALEHDPYLVAAIINLANIHYSREELAEAQALYERAIGLESDFFEAHFNLGNIYHDLGRFTEAQLCYTESLRLNPYYADAHFYLAVTFEKMGSSREARPHWRAYRQLAPQGEWVALAKEFSD